MNRILIKWLAISLSIVALLLSSRDDALAQIILGTPKRLDGNANRGWAESGDISADGLTLFYQVGGLGTAGPADIFVAFRDSLTDPWDDPQSVVINAPSDDASPALSPNGQELYFSDGQLPRFSNNLRPGGMGRADIWLSMWNEESETWGEVQNVEEINTIDQDSQPNLSADGLELYFGSNRPGGAGDMDIWVARRPTVNDPWSEPENLGLELNSRGEDGWPALSPDGRMLAFSSNRAGSSGNGNLWLTTREHLQAGWGEPIHLGFEVNSTSGWTYDPDFSYDGTTLYFARCCGGSMWQVPVSPIEGVPVNVGDVYVQNFDDALSTESGRGTDLPPGWALSEGGVIFKNTTTDSFPENSRPNSSVIPIYNAGRSGDADRALTLGVNDPADSPTLQLVAQIDNTDASGFQLQFDLEAWDVAGRGTVDVPGEAAFNVSVELDSGDGFSLLYDLGEVTTGSVLSAPQDDHLNGNTDNVISFDSGMRAAAIPAGSELRIRWQVPEVSDTRGWVFGLDNVALSLFDDSPLQAGDADQDLEFDQLDLVQVQVSGKYLTGQVATWGEGDWNGAPGGSQGDPPAGDGLFNQLDIIAAQQGAAYLTGPYAVMVPGGQRGDGQTSVVYDASTGELAVDAPEGTELTSINIDSAAGIFTGNSAQNLGGSFDNDADNNIFKATFGSSFGSLSFGSVAQTGLSEDFVLQDLTAIGSLAGGGDLGNVDLVYVPEPASVLLLSIGLAIGLVHFRRVNR